MIGFFGQPLHLIIIWPGIVVAVVGTALYWALGPGRRLPGYSACGGGSAPARRRLRLAVAVLAAVGMLLLLPVRLRGW